MLTRRPEGVSTFAKVGGIGTYDFKPSIEENELCRRKGGMIDQRGVEGFGMSPNNALQ